MTDPTYMRLADAARKKLGTQCVVLVAIGEDLAGDLSIWCVAPSYDDGNMTKDHHRQLNDLTARIWGDTYAK